VDYTYHLAASSRADGAQRNLPPSPSDARLHCRPIGCGRNGSNHALLLRAFVGAMAHPASAQTFYSLPPCSPCRRSRVPGVRNAPWTSALAGSVSSIPPFFFPPHTRQRDLHLCQPDARSYPRDDPRAIVTRRACPRLGKLHCSRLFSRPRLALGERTRPAVGALAGLAGTICSL
jgi:hypothetical protein